MATNIPLNTTIPITIRACEPAPVAVSNGTTPKINAKAVIKIGRKRSFAATIAASKIGTPLSYSSLANSTIKIAFLATNPINNTKPI